MTDTGASLPSISPPERSDRAPDDSGATELEREAVRDSKEKRRHQRLDHEQRLQLRQSYATGILAALALQLFFLNLYFIMEGGGVAQWDAWTFRTFILAVFGETVALALAIIANLFPKI